MLEKEYIMNQEEKLKPSDGTTPEKIKKTPQPAASGDGGGGGEGIQALLQGEAGQAPKDDDERMKMVDELRGSPMSVGTLEEIIDDNHAIVSSAMGPEYYVSILSIVNKDMLEPGCSVLMHNKVLSIVGILQDDTDPMVNMMRVDKAPLESYADIGGLEEQIQEIKEAVEYPLTHPEIYEDVGIKPPKGVILYGSPGTGKTLLAKAVAHHTSATFLRIVGSEVCVLMLRDDGGSHWEILNLFCPPLDLSIDS